MRRSICLILIVAMAMLLPACDGFTFSFTGSGSKMTMEVMDAKDGDFGESYSIEVGKNRIVKVESSLEKGELQIDFAEAHIFYDDDGPDSEEAGDVVASMKVGPGSSESLELEPGDYILQLTAIGATNGKVTVEVVKQ